MQPKTIPLHQRVKRRKHISIARLQDIVVETLYRVFPNSVLHGGTAIWRCYSGTRFSEDIDVYIERDEKRIELLFKYLKNVGFRIEKKRVKENSLYSKLIMDREEIRLEALFLRKRGIVREYETYEGMFINIYTLLPEDLIEEKVAAYRKRRKIRDLYDIFFLLKYVKDYKRISASLDELLDRFHRPLDEGDLGALILVGISPNTDDMLDYIRRWKT